MRVLPALVSNSLTASPPRALSPLLSANAHAMPPFGFHSFALSPEDQLLRSDKLLGFFAHLLSDANSQEDADALGEKTTSQK